MIDLWNLTKEQLISLKYFLLRDGYNYFNNQSRGYKLYSEKLSQYVNQHNIRRDLGLKVFSDNFSKYGELIYQILLNQNYENLLNKYLKGAGASGMGPYHGCAESG